MPLQSPAISTCLDPFINGNGEKKNSLIFKQEEIADYRNDVHYAE